MGGDGNTNQVEQDYRSVVTQAKKSFLLCTDCLLRIINHLGHFFSLFLPLIFFVAIPFRPSDINMKHCYDKIISHLFSEASLSVLIREKRCLVGI